MDQWSTGSVLSWVILAVVSSAGIAYWALFWRTPKSQRRAWWIDHSALVRWGFLDVLIVAFVWLSSQVLAVFLLNRMAGIDPEGPLSDFQHTVLIGLTSLLQLAVVIGGFAWLVARYRHRWSEFGLTVRQLPEGVRQGLIAFAMWMPVVWLVQLVLVLFIEYEHPTLQKLQESPSLPVLGAVWFSAVLVAPIVEELLFRGLLQGWFQRIRRESLSDPDSLIVGARDIDIESGELGNKQKSNRPVHVWAIVFTAVLFGLAHPAQGPAPYSLFVLSLGLGYLYQRTGSLLACIFVHMLLNAITMLIHTVDVFF